MKRPGFFEGVLIAATASVIASALFLVITWFFYPITALKIVISIGSFIYLLYLLKRSNEKTGRIVVCALWFSLTIFAWLLSLPLLLLVLFHITFLWLVRSLYFYSSVISALIDLGLTGLSIAIAIWAGLHTNSIFLSTWCFFLTQALFVFIPNSVTKQSLSTSSCQTDNFEHAFRVAESALRKLSSNS